MRASSDSEREWPVCSVSFIKRRRGWFGVPIAILVLTSCVVETASATDLTSSQTGYVLSQAGNPYNVVAGAIIDTSAEVSNAIYGDINKAATWVLTNNGAVTGGYFSVEFDSPVAILNNGSMVSRVTTALALYGGGNVTNSAGANIVGRFDAVFANSASSSVTNAGDIGGSAADITKTQSSIHLPSGGTVTNLATGRIAAYGPGILANSATTIQNAGLIISIEGTAIDLTLTSGATGTGSVVSNSGSIVGQGGTAILFGPGDNSLMLAGTSTITGIVDASSHSASGTSALILGGTSPGSFDISTLAATGQYRGFNTLRKNDSSTWTLTGTNGSAQSWLVSAGGIAMAGQLNGSLIATPGATGVDMEVLSGGSIHASSASAVSINDESRVVNSGSITSSAESVAAVVATGAGTSIVNAGFIAGQGVKGAGVAIDAPVGAASLTNVQGGLIESAAGIAVHAGSNVSIANFGSIAAEGANGMGIAIDAPVGMTSLINQRGASIKGATAISVKAGSNVSIANAGSIAGNVIGMVIDAPTGAASLTNAQGGLIESNGGVAVTAGSNVSIVNAGTLIGNGNAGTTGTAVRFTGSNNRLTLDSGSVVSGDIDGGNGLGNVLVLQGSGILSSHTYGFSTMTMQGADWTIASPVEMTSASTIASGILRLTGTLTSPVITVKPDAILTGTGTLQGAITLQGVIAPGVQNAAAVAGLQPLAIGTLSVVGSYKQAGGSRYAVDVSPEGNGLISVDGTAALQGGMVQMRLRARSFTPSDTYKILSTTAGLSGMFSGITTLNPFVSATLVYDADNAYVHVNRGFQFAGGTPNQIAVEAALDHGVAGIGAGAVPTRDFLSVAGDLLNLEGSSAYAALDQLSAEAYTALPNAHFEAARLGMEAIDSRLSAARVTNACSAGETASTSASESASGARVCSWISMLGSTSKISGYDTWLGQQTGLAGVISGLDYRVAPKVTLGAAIAAIHGNTSTDTLPVHGQFDSYQAALYGSYVPGPYWLQATIGYARNDDSMKRSLFFTDTPRTALGSVDGNQYFASLRNGVDLPMGGFGILAPFVALEMQRVESPGFTETGAQSVNLAVSGNTANSTRSSLGAQWRNGFDWLGHAWNFNGELAWAHQYGTQTQTISASFEGATASGFTLHGGRPARDMAQIGLGTRVALSSQTHAFLRYDGELGGRGHTHGGSAGFDYRW